MSEKKRNSDEFRSRISQINKQLERKYEILRKQANYTELLDESSFQDAQTLESDLSGKLDEFEELLGAVDESKKSLREIAEKDTTERVAALENEIQQVVNAIHHTKLLIDLEEQLEATEACGEDTATAMKYLKTIESSCRDIHDWSGGGLLVLSTISQYLINKRYTLEAEQRKTLMENSAETKLDWFDHSDEQTEDVQVEEGGDEKAAGQDVAVHSEESSQWLERVREVLQKPLEPTEEVESFGGLGDVRKCQMSFWLRPLVIETLAVPNRLENTVSLYISVFSVLLPSLPHKGVAFFYNNSMYLCHQILLSCLMAKSRGALDSALSLRKFADQQLLGRVQQMKFDCSSQTVDEFAFKEYPKYLRKYSAALKGVLPANVYDKILRLLSEHYVGSLVCAIVNMEDMESVQADRYAALVGGVLEELQSILPKDMKVRVWSKAAELQNVLSYGLKEFAANWKDRDSQLRLNFDSDEVKHLVRAIFQNSDMRSSVLSQIY